MKTKTLVAIIAVLTLALMTGCPQKNEGGTGPESVLAQIAGLESDAARAAEAARATPRLHDLFAQLREAEL